MKGQLILDVEVGDVLTFGYDLIHDIRDTRSRAKRFRSMKTSRTLVIVSTNGVIGSPPLTSALLRKRPVSGD